MSGTAPDSFVKLLPAVNQTDALTKFFAASIDQVFRPGQARPLNGYIGQKPVYYNAATDFYAAESTTERAAYQLEPGMVSFDGNGNLLASLVYPDLVASLADQGAVTSDPSRLFDTEWYSWAPPVNIDMVLNYQSYGWFGDDSMALPTLRLIPPVARFTGDGTTTTFALPASLQPLPQTPALPEHPTALVNGTVVGASIAGNNLVLDSAPPTGSQVVTFRIPDIATALRGIGSATLTGLTPDTAAASLLSSGMRLEIQDTNHAPSGFDASGFDPVSGLDNQPFGFDVEPFDTNSRFFADGIGQNVRLTSDAAMVYPIFNGQYVTIDRASADGNEWSQRNFWAHADSYAWSGKTFPSRAARRPVIEFMRDLVLYPALDSTGQAVVDQVGTRNYLHPMPWGGEQSEPLFMLFDVAGNAYLDPALFASLAAPWPYPAPYLQSTFLGNRIFGYAHDGGALDPVLRQPIVLDSNFYPVFQNDAVLVPSSYNAGTVNQPVSQAIAGLACYVCDPRDGTTTAVPSSLWHPTGLTTDQFVDPATGLFHIPYNLEYNPAARDVATISLSDYGDHFAALLSLQNFFLGNPNGDNNYRDTARDPALGTRIRQHQAPLLKAMLLASAAGFDYFAALRYADQEYSRFRAKFMRKLVSMQRAGTLPATGTLDQFVVAVLDALTIDRNSSFPFAYSTMAGGRGTAHPTSFHIPPTPSALGVTPAVPPPLFSLAAAASTGDTTLQVALAYPDQPWPVPTAGLEAGMQPFGADGFITTNTPIIIRDIPSATSITLSAALTADIPAGTMLGAFVLDTVLGQSVALLRGHDGSLTPAFNDWRDLVLLALEARIYAYLPASLQAAPAFRLRDWLGNAFQEATDWVGAPLGTRMRLGYQYSEVQGILTRFFELWVQNNRVDYRNNTGFDATKPFTWNYTGATDYFGNLAQGSWRNLYQLYYETERPHQAPWEMLGYASQPSWWRTTYGAATYNTTTKTAGYPATTTVTGVPGATLWGDLEAGMIRDPADTGINPRYARPGLSAIIPVDGAGNLLDPIAARVIVTTPTYNQASQPWQAGDLGPAEAYWRTTPSFRFALAQLAMLLKPARLVEACWDVENTGFVNQQWVDLRPATLYQRPQNANLAVHGELLSTGTVAVVRGISQWIADYLRANGQASTGFGTAVRGLDVRLIHRMAGFVSQDAIKVVADNFGLVPAEDTQIAFYQSPDHAVPAYSGVIIEWTGRGWQVVGYDIEHPYFTVYPPDTARVAGVISLATTPEPALHPWLPSTFYPITTLVVWRNSVWQSAKSHTSGPSFETEFWEARPDLNPNPTRAPRVLTYVTGLPDSVRVPYGTLFVSWQEVGDFLLGWERYLVAAGWQFEQLDPQTGHVLNWSQAVLEYLQWAQVPWQPGNFIAVSPGATGLRFVAPSGTVRNVDRGAAGFFGLLDRSGRPIAPDQASVTRLGSQLDLHASNNNIFAARLELTSVEHALVFSNVTIFNDPIYLPLFAIRQPRLKLIGYASADWVGRLDAPGYLVNGPALVPNFANAVDDIRLMFDIEAADRPELWQFARHNIGFQKRDYLNNLLLADIEQFEFYQGMIQAKGSIGALSNIFRSQQVTVDSRSNTFLEEWAIRLSRFGAPLAPRASFRLVRDDVHLDPQFVRFVAADPTSSADWIMLGPDDPRWHDRPAPGGFFPALAVTQPEALPTAGPVRVGDADLTARDLTVDLPARYMALYDAAQASTPAPVFAAGTLIWVFAMPDRRWTILRACDLGTAGVVLNQVQTITEDASLTGGLMRLRLSAPHGLAAADLGYPLVIDGLSNSVPDLVGTQLIIAIPDTTTVLVTVPLSGGVINYRGYDFTLTAGLSPAVRVLRPIRFADRTALAASAIRFAKGDLAWVDSDATPGQWAVLQRDEWGNWEVSRQQPVRPDSRAIRDAIVYNGAVSIATDPTGNRQMFVDQPTLPGVAVIDPPAGLLPGAAAVELTYQTSYDPARYNAGAAAGAVDLWGAAQVGQLWWNLATARYLDPFTDVIGADPARDAAEIAYRIGHWGQLAPGAAIDIYQWVASPLDPLTYQRQGPGQVYNAANPSYVTETVFNTALQRDQVIYYFWVAGLTTVPVQHFRHSSAAAVASMLASPNAAGVPWLAPIMADGMLLGGLDPFLTDRDTVFSVRLNAPAGEDDSHAEWILLRSNDARSPPPNWLWRHVRDSIAGFDDALNPLPWSSLSPARQLGLYAGQSLFTVGTSTPWQFGAIYLVDALVVAPGTTTVYRCLVPHTSGTVFADDLALGRWIATLAVPREGLMAARRCFVTALNTILARTPVMLDRAEAVAATVTRQDVPGTLLDGDAIPYLFWSRPDQSYAIEPPPPMEYDFEVFDLAGRDALLANPEFSLPMATPPRVLVNRLASAAPSWSIWQLDPARVATALGVTTPGTVDAAAALVAAQAAAIGDQNSLFVLRPAYDVALPDDGTTTLVSYILGLARQAQHPPAGLRIYSPRLDAFGFWSIWTFVVGFDQPSFDQPSDTMPDASWYARSTFPPPYNGFDDPNVTPALWRAQRYNVANFQQTVDYYAPGYAATDPPMVTYPTIAARDLAEGTSPLHGFVAIADDGTGAWQWTAYQPTGTGSNAWVMVARQNSTVQFSTQFYNATKRVYGLATTDPADIPYRDGSWELRALAAALAADGLLTGGEINELFFSLVHFIHTQQPALDWAFKTSFMILSGYNIALAQTGVQPPDLSNDLLSYIDEVKPYRVKVRDRAIQYASPIDTVTMHVSDFDNPPYASGAAAVTRLLTPTRPGDLVLLNQLPAYADWLSVEQAMVAALAAAPNQPARLAISAAPVRQMTVRLVFDRLVGVAGTADGACTVGGAPSTESYAGTALARIIAAFQPTSAMPVLDLWQAMNLQFKGLTLGRTLPLLASLGIQTGNPPHLAPVGEFDWPYCGFDTWPFDVVLDPALTVYDGNDSPTGQALQLNPDVANQDPAEPAVHQREAFYQLADPIASANHPEERASLAVDDGVVITVTSQATPGAPPVTVHQYDVSGLPTSSATLFVGAITQSGTALLVFRDGVRSQFGSYTQDYFGRTATVDLTAGFSQVIALGFGFAAAPGGGATRSITEQYFLSYAGAPVQLKAPTTANHLDVVVNGTLVDSANLVLSGTSLDFAAGHAPSVGADMAVVVYGGGAASACRLQAETLAYTSGKTWTLQFPDTQTVPEHAGTIVDVNGLRLTPPLTFYGAITSGARYFTMDTVPNNGVTIKLYVNGVLYPSPIPICTTTDPASPYPLHVVLPGGASLPTDPASGWFVIYQGNVIACNPVFTSNSVVCVLYQDHDYTVENGVLTLLSSLSSTDVTVAFTFANAGALGLQTHTFVLADNGVYPLTPPPAIDQAWVATGGKTLCNGTDFDFSASALCIEAIKQGSGRILATILTGAVARPAERHLSATITPAVLRMTPALDADGNQVTAVPPHRTMAAPLQRMAHSWESTALRDAHAGVLAAPLAPADASATITVPAVALSARLLPRAPLPVPDLARNQPGVVWLDGERIEYFSLAMSGTTATIGALRRGTGGTPVRAHPVGMVAYAGDAVRVLDLDVPGLIT